YDFCRQSRRLACFRWSTSAVFPRVLFYFRRRKFLIKKGDDKGKKMLRCLLIAGRSGYDEIGRSHGVRNTVDTTVCRGGGQSVGIERYPGGGYVKKLRLQRFEDVLLDINGKAFLF